MCLYENVQYVQSTDDAGYLIGAEPVQRRPVLWSSSCSPTKLLPDIGALDVELHDGHCDAELLTPLITTRPALIPSITVCRCSLKRWPLSSGLLFTNSCRCSAHECSLIARYARLVRQQNCCSISVHSTLNWTQQTHQMTICPALVPSITICRSSLTDHWLLSTVVFTHSIRS